MSKYFESDVCPSYLSELIGDIDDIVIVCIGSPKSVGDSIGPRVGTKLKLLGFNVIGTMENPVHALNLHDTINYIIDRYRDKRVVAIDASVGSRKNLFTIKVGEGPLRPGLGCGKSLPQVGDMYIKGIICESYEFTPYDMDCVDIEDVYSIVDRIEHVFKIIKEENNG